MNSEQIEKIRLDGRLLITDMEFHELCDLAQRGLASGEPVAKPMAYACIVDGAFHGAYRHELTAILADMEDAERYRWLRMENANEGIGWLEMHSIPSCFDAAIDEARRAGR